MTKYDMVHHYVVTAVHGVQEAAACWIGVNRGGDILAVDDGLTEPAWVATHRRRGGTVQPHRVAPQMYRDQLAAGQRAQRLNADRRAAG